MASKVKNPEIDFLTFLFVLCGSVCTCGIYVCVGVCNTYRGQRTVYRRQFIPFFNHEVPKDLRSSDLVTSVFTPWHLLTSGKLFEKSVLLY